MPLRVVVNMLLERDQLLRHEFDPHQVVDFEFDYNRYLFRIGICSGMQRNAHNKVWRLTVVCKIWNTALVLSRNYQSQTQPSPSSFAHFRLEHLSHPFVCYYFYLFIFLFFSFIFGFSALDWVFTKFMGRLWLYSFYVSFEFFFFFLLLLWDIFQSHWLIRFYQ